MLTTLVFFENLFLVTLDAVNHDESFYSIKTISDTFFKRMSIMQCKKIDYILDEM